MQLGDSPDEAAFRAKAGAWLAEHAPPHRMPDGGPGAEPDLAEEVERWRTWQAVCASEGWAGLAWPTAFGGAGESPMAAMIFADEQKRYRLPNGPSAVGVGMVGPTLMVHGTPDQQAAYLGPMLRGEHLWCQLFSEPGAGSDLAGLGTRAERDGDEWVLHGQKVWTSFARYADFAICLARTDPAAPKHQGITYFLVDMRSPGVDVRPLRQINGSSHFNEVFLDGVRVPASAVVGDVDGGWKVAQTTLGSERAFIFSGTNTWTIDDVLALLRSNGHAADPVATDGVMRAVCRARALDYLGLRLRTAVSQQRRPGPEALVAKLAYSRHWTQTVDLAVQLLGAGGMLHSEWTTYFLNQFAVRLGGGSDEIHRNIIGERALGLPREPGDDRTTPWKELARA